MCSCVLSLFPLSLFHLPISIQQSLPFLLSSLLSPSLLPPDPPPTTALPTTSAGAATLPGADTTGTAPDHRQAQFSSPTQGSPSSSGSATDSHLGTIVGGVVGGVLFLVLLLGLVGVCFMRQRRTFRGDYYTKQYLGPSDMQKDNQLDVLQPHELQVYSSGDGSGDSGKGSQDLKPPKPAAGDLIYDYASDRKDREEWGGDHQQPPRVIGRDGSYYNDGHHNNQHPFPQQHQQHSNSPPAHTGLNGSPYLPDDNCYDNGTDSDYVSHMDGSVISRREWYV